MPARVAEGARVCRSRPIDYDPIRRAKNFQGLTRSIANSLAGSGCFSPRRAAHLKADGRLTIMFCAFEGPPNILRLYGRGEVLRRESAAYDELLTSAFAGEEPIGARQMIRLHVDLVNTSCGYGMSVYAYCGDRPSLDNWSPSQGEEDLEAYWPEMNLASIDSLPTGLLDEV
jgi:hypothetical protein